MKNFLISIAGTNEMLKQDFTANFIIKAETIGEAVRKLAGYDKSHMKVKSMTGKKWENNEFFKVDDNPTFPDGEDVMLYSGTVSGVNFILK